MFDFSYRQQQQQQQQLQSVLTPDNRRFLDNQGSKSPEVPRKRMIIGHRSYTFGCDGDLIELDPVSPTSPTPDFTPKPKPLLHKDSVLSTATSLSLTSIDSDSDTDDRSSIFGIQPRHNAVHEQPTNSTTKLSHFPSPNISPESVAEKPIPQKVYPLYPISSKRMSSTSLSSWESEAVLSPIVSHSDVCCNTKHQFTEEPVTELPEGNDEGFKTVTKHYGRFHSSPESPLSMSWPMRYESIDEDVEAKLSEDLSSTSTSKQPQDISYETDADGQIDSHDGNEEQYTEVNNGYVAECRERAAHVERHSGSANGSDEGHASDDISGPSGVQKCTKTLEEQMEIQRDVISLLQIRRGSFKRQQRVLDEEPLEVSVKDCPELTEQCETSSDMSHEETQPLRLESDPAKSTRDVKEETEYECAYVSRTPVDEMSPLENSGTQEHRTHRVHCVSNAEGERPRQETQKVELVQEGKPGLYLKDEELSDSLNFTKEQAGPEFLLKCAEKVEKCQNTDLLQVSSASTKGDSFEMEEASIYTILSFLIASYKEYRYSKLANLRT
jgi:hypothetical protein